MNEDDQLQDWFCNEVLPIEPALTRFLRRNWRDAEEIEDIRQEVYARMLNGARRAFPEHTSSYLFMVARNLLINRAKRERVVSFDLVADLDDVHRDIDFLAAERELMARDTLRRVQSGMSELPPRCREVVRLRKLEGLSTREAAERMGVGLHTIERQLTLGMRALTDFVLGGTGKIERKRYEQRRNGSGTP